LAPIISSSFKFVIEEVDKRIYKKMVNKGSVWVGVGDNINTDSQYRCMDGCGKSTSGLKQMGLNSDASTVFLSCSVILENIPSVKKVGIQRFIHPWDFLEVINNVLEMEINQ
jgi:hypothetical protein